MDRWYVESRGAGRTRRRRRSWLVLSLAVVAALAAWLAIGTDRAAPDTPTGTSVVTPVTHR